MTYDDFIRQWSDEVAASAPPIPGAVLQPGLGVPAAAIDQVAANPVEVEMPAVDARVEQPEIEMPPVDVAAERAAQEPQFKIGFPRPWVEEAEQTAAMDQQIAASMTPDAISGAGAPPLPPMQPGLGIPQRTLDRAFGQQLQDQAVDQRVEGSEQLAEPRDAFETGFDAELARRAGLSNADVRLEDAQREADERVNDEERLRELLRKDTEERAAAETARHEARRRYMHERAQIDAEAKQLAQQKVGERDWYKEGGIGRTVGAMLVAFAGGLVQHLNGGRNLGLEAINKSIDRFIAAKQADREHQRGLLGDRARSLTEQMDLADQDWREAQAYRQAALERAKFEIETFQQNFDPEGSRARAVDLARRQIDAELVANAQAAQAAREKELEGRLKLSFDIEKNQRDRDKNRRDEEAHR
ncbi:MAG TPA: hypothetical protein VM513_03275, partial [Kofleriaceae bacterium]|nr:hypothetical protein [Kofleriaceae bacterium]